MVMGRGGGMFREVPGDSYSDDGPRHPPVPVGGGGVGVPVTRGGRAGSAARAQQGPLYTGGTGQSGTGGIGTGKTGAQQKCAE